MESVIRSLEVPHSALVRQVSDVASPGQAVALKHIDWPDFAMGVRPTLEPLCRFASTITNLTVLISHFSPQIVVFIQRYVSLEGESTDKGS